MRISIFFLTFFAFISDDPKDLLRQEIARHQGTWVAVSMEREEAKTSSEIVETITRTMDGDHVVWKRSGKPFAGTTIKLDPSTDPKSIDVTPDGGPDRDKPVLGIYKLVGDSLTICMADAGGPRPKEFSSPKGSKRTLMSFRRADRLPKGQPKK
jgi:uncharacterized protein (TIGR03067 family)